MDGHGHHEIRQRDLPYRDGVAGLPDLGELPAQLGNVLVYPEIGEAVVCGVPIDVVEVMR